MSVRFNQLLMLIRYLRLKLNSRVFLNGFVALGSNVQIFLEHGSSLVFEGRCTLKPGTVIFVKKDAMLIIGDNTSTGHDTEISVGKRVKIGSDVIMAPYTYITDSNHRYDSPDKKIREQSMDIGSVEIGNDVWIGRSAMILKGAGVGNRTVVAAGAIVSKPFKSGVIIGGIPARVLREIE